MSELKIKGEIVMFQTPIGVEGELKNAIPGTVKKTTNTILDNLKEYLAECIAASTNEALDDLFVSDGTVASVGAANDGKQGMMVLGGADEDGEGTVSHIMTTTLNAGGDGSETYAEFYGYIDGAVTVQSSLTLGTYVNATTEVVSGSSFATVAINETVAANRRFHYYWKISIS